jgi:threonine/homoserine/homoserine lactone efflux protein
MSGFLTNLLNPKVALFYLAFLPQFIQPTDSLLLKSVKLGSIHLSFTFTWLIVVAVLVGQLRPFLTHPQVMRVLLATTGFILMGLGAWLALEG